MSYSYEIERPYTLTDEGQRRLFQVRNVADQALKISGAVRADKLMIGSGDSWQMMAIIDRLVELGELHEIPTNGAWQYKIFVAGRP